MEYWFEKRQLLKFQLFNCDKDEAIGEYEVTMGKIMGATDQIHKGMLMDFEMIIRAVTVQEQEKTGKGGFQDYLRSGWQISQAIAIDYTGSNGDQRKPDSLHFMGPDN